MRVCQLLSSPICLIGTSFLLQLGCRSQGVAAFSLPSTLSTKPPASSSSNSPVQKPMTFQYTHLEVNGMLWQVPEADLSLVVDPIASELNFGIPWGYRANKLVLDERATLDTIVQAAPTHCLLSQGLDDHTHLATLTKLISRLPDLQFVVAPSARDKVASILPEGEASHRITVLQPGGPSLLLGMGDVRLHATPGALVGPPWQARENGWLLHLNDRTTVYMEPHGDVTDQALRGLRADVAILPVKDQSLPAQVLPKHLQFKLVHGGERALEIAQALRSSVVIPLGNGDLRTDGPLAGLVEASGSMEEFERLIRDANAKGGKNCPEIRVVRPTPGVPLSVPLPVDS